MSKVPTAEEFFENNHGLFTSFNVKDKSGKLVRVVSIDKAIEFTKLHVKAALEAAKTKVKVGIIGSYIDKDLILNAYPDDYIA